MPSRPGSTNAERLTNSSSSPRYCSLNKDFTAEVRAGGHAKRSSKDLNSQANNTQSCSSGSSGGGGEASSLLARSSITFGGEASSLLTRSSTTTFPQPADHSEEDKCWQRSKLRVVPVGIPVASDASLVCRGSDFAEGHESPRVGGPNEDELGSPSDTAESGMLKVTKRTREASSLGSSWGARKPCHFARDTHASDGMGGRWQTMVAQLSHGIKITERGIYLNRYRSAREWPGQGWSTCHTQNKRTCSAEREGHILVVVSKMYPC